MKKQRFFIATFMALTMSMMFCACDDGSEAYKSLKKDYNGLKKNIKEAKTCSDIEKVSSMNFDIYIRETESNLTFEEKAKLLEISEKIDALITEKTKKLCNK